MRLKRMFAPMALALAALPGMASATIVTESSNQLGVNVFQQTANNPCIIGDPSCKEPAGMTYTSESGTPGSQGSTYDLFSSLYKAGSPANFGSNIIPTSFIVGIDENIAAGAGAESLVFFNTYDCGSTGTPGALAGALQGSNTAFAFNAPPSGITCSLDTANSFTGPFTIPNNNNGNGYSDLLLKGFSLTAGHNYVFRASISGDTDGMEEFFLIPAGSTPAPEPGTLALLGLGFAAMGAVVRRRRH